MTRGGESASHISFSNLTLSNLFALGPSIKDVRIILAVFDTPFPHVGILTLIYLTSTLISPPPKKKKYSDVFYG
jgi:hypothetical protein